MSDLLPLPSPLLQSTQAPVEPRSAMLQLGLIKLGTKRSQHFNYDMRVTWFGLLLPTEFMTRFMPLSGAPLVVPDVEFTSIEGLTENKMRAPFLSDLLKAKFCTNLCANAYVTAHASEDASQLRPDEGCVEPSAHATPASTSGDAQAVPTLHAQSELGLEAANAQPKHTPSDWHGYGLVVKFKSETKHDPFPIYFEGEALGEKKKKVQNTDPDATHTLNQLVRHAADIFSLQHRTHAFQLLICGDTARFIYWDRAGAVLSERFDFHKNPKILAEFFARYQRMDGPARGWDKSVEEPSQEEVDTFREHVTKLLDDMKDPKSGQRRISKAEQTLDKSYPPYKIIVNPGMVGDRPHELIVQKPIEVTHTPTGRGMRGYIAYSLSEKRIVFLKDSWRAQINGRPGEDTIYSLLGAAGVEGLPRVLCAGDVCTDEENGKPQTTRAQEVANERGPPHRVKSLGIRAYMHHRVVQELAYSLSTSANSKQYIEAFRDAFKTLGKARAANIHHRDISFNNIMLNAEGRVVVNDWDHAGIIHEINTKGGISRIGTWPFMSIAMLDDPYKQRDILDDFEALYWSKLFGALKYFDGKIKSDLEMFFERNTKDTDHGKILVGGVKKSAFLLFGGRLCFESKPLRLLLSKLTSIWRNYYYLQSQAKRQEEAEEAEEDYGIMFAKLHETILSAGYWCDVIDNYLKMPGWDESDTIPDRLPTTRAVETAVRERLFSASMLSEDCTSQTDHIGNNDESHAAVDASGIITPPGILHAADGATFAHFLPCSPPSARESIGSSSGVSAKHFINSNGKRTLETYPEDNERSVDHISSVGPDAKRLRIDIGDCQESSANRYLEESQNADGEPRKPVGLGEKHMGLVTE